MSIVKLTAEQWERGFFFALASNIGQPARLLASLANQLQGHLPEGINPAELHEIADAAERIEGAAMILRRIVSEARTAPSKPVLMIAAE